MSFERRDDFDSFFVKKKVAQTPAVVDQAQRAARPVLDRLVRCVADAARVADVWGVRAARRPSGLRRPASKAVRALGRWEHDSFLEMEELSPFESPLSLSLSLALCFETPPLSLSLSTYCGKRDSKELYKKRYFTNLGCEEAFGALERAIDALCDPSTSLKAQYEARLATVTDIVEHLPTLEALASECGSVLECGVRGGESSWALLFQRVFFFFSHTFRQVFLNLGKFLEKSGLREILPVFETEKYAL